MASITFTDNDGAVVLSNGLTSPGDRFRAWVPLVSPIGPLHHALGTGIPYLYEHRCDHGAKFQLPYIPNASQSDTLRLIRHVLRAGVFTVSTGDAYGAEYECYLWPGSSPEMSEPDPITRERTLTVSALNSTEAVMTCVYP